MLSISWKHCLAPNGKEVRRITKQPNLTAIIQSRRVSIFGHIARMDDDADAKMILTAPPPENWKRRPGRPCITWLNTVQRDLRAYNLHWTKQSTWLRTVLGGGWWLRTVLRSPNGTCQERRRPSYHPNSSAFKALNNVCDWIIASDSFSAPQIRSTILALYKLVCMYVCM